MHEVETSALLLPWPPSANRYWRHTAGRVLVSQEARQYKRLVRDLSLTWKRPCLAGRVHIQILAYPPDKRVRDIDNICKVCLDALEEAGLYTNDSQIDKLMIERMPSEKPGRLLVWISEL